MTRLLQKVCLLLVAACGVALPSCKSSSDTQWRKPVPPPVDSSGQPWNRPTKTEAAGRFGNMMPQSR